MSSEDTMNERNEWSECPAGTLRAFSKQQGGSDRRRIASIAAASSLVVLLAIGIVAMQPGSSAGPSSPTEAKQLSCVQTFRLMGAYFANELSEEEVGLVHDHLEYCPHCKRKYQQQADSLGKKLLVSSSQTAYEFSISIASMAPEVFWR